MTNSLYQIKTYTQYVMWQALDIALKNCDLDVHSRFFQGQVIAKKPPKNPDPVNIILGVQNFLML